MKWVVSKHFCSGSEELVDQAEISKNQSYLIDSIQIQVSSKLLDITEIKRLFLEERLSAAQIARRYDVVKSVILGLLHRSGVRLNTKIGRSNNPENYRNHSPPYGYQVKDGKLVINKAELKACRLIVDLRDRKGYSTSDIAAEIEKRGFKNRNGKTVWNSNTILKIYKRWKNKL